MAFLCLLDKSSLQQSRAEKHIYGQIKRGLSDVLREYHLIGDISPAILKSSTH